MKGADRMPPGGEYLTEMTDEYHRAVRAVYSLSNSTLKLPDEGKLPCYRLGKLACGTRNEASVENMKRVDMAKRGFQLQAVDPLGHQMAPEESAVCSYASISKYKLPGEGLLTF